MAKVNTKGVGEVLQQLFDLQTIDTKLDEIQILKGELPMEVSDLEDELVGLQTRLTKVEGAMNDLTTEKSNHAANIKEAKALIKKYEKQLDEVKNNREYEALTKEIELQKLEIQLSEKKTRGVDVAIEKKEETLTTAKTLLKTKKADLDLKKVELEKIQSKTEKEEKKLKKASDKAKVGVEERLIAAYERIRNRYKNGLAVVTIKRSACGGCFNQVPPQVNIEIGQKKQIITCEHCGRIIIDNETAGIVEEVAEK